MYAASIEGLSRDERAAGDESLAPRRSYRRLLTWSCRTCVHSAEVVADDARPVRALPPAPSDRPALRSVPAIDPERFGPDRLAAIRTLGGDLRTGA